LVESVSACWEYRHRREALQTGGLGSWSRVVVRRAQGPSERYIDTLPTGAHIDPGGDQTVSANVSVTHRILERNR
jgi:hypothetical protein